MRILIKENKFKSSFNRLMSEYVGMEPIDRWYEYYDDFKWKEMNSINFYRDVEVDWEEDYWTFQYLKDYEGDNNPKKFPRLICDTYQFGNFKNTFGPFFEDLIKEWFEMNYNLPVTSVVLG